MPKRFSLNIRPVWLMSQLDSDLWQSGTLPLFTAVSLAGIVLVGQAEVSTWIDLTSQLGIALIGIMLLLLWRSLYHRWIFIIHVDFYRMKEIEVELDHMWMVRYVHYLNDHGAATENCGPEGSRLSRLQRSFEGTTGVRDISISKHLTYLVSLLIGSWIMVCARVVILYIN